MPEFKGAAKILLSRSTHITPSSMTPPQTRAQSLRRAPGQKEYAMPTPGRDTQTWRRLRLQCFRRDKAANAPCALCGDPIDYTLKPSSCRDAWEPDHKLPIDTHPQFAEVPENIQPAHLRCNRAKRNKAGVNNLGERSREW